ncbi:hypothetical protein [Vibrio phage BONAISHI]|nr:hypothetical protein [Vibrio phage BONAISHI]
MKYAIGTEYNCLLVRVPTLDRKTNGDLKVLTARRSLDLHSVEKARFELIAWQTRRGQEEWGRNRWERIKEKGCLLYTSQWFGVRVVLDDRKNGPRWMTKMMIKSEGQRSYRGFGIKKYGDETARKLAEFQATLWRCHLCQTDLILPEGIVNDLTDGHIDLFPELVKMTNGDAIYYGYLGDKE